MPIFFDPDKSDRDGEGPLLAIKLAQDDARRSADFAEDRAVLHAREEPLAQQFGVRRGEEGLRVY